MCKKESLKIIITGPTGAIGMALIRKCLAQGDRVYAICHRGSIRMSKLPVNNNLQVIEANLSEIHELDKQRIGLLKSEAADVFYHFAWAGTSGEARNNMLLQIQNIQYTIDAVQLAARLGCTAFIGAGSQAEYGLVDGVLRAETPAYPENGYGMAKLCAGQMSRYSCEKLGMRHIWTRILSVYGPYDNSSAMVTSTIIKLLQGKHASCTSGEQLWDYLYSEDAADAMYLLASKGQNAKIYVLGSGKARMLKDYINQIVYTVQKYKGDVGTVGFGEIPYADRQVMHLEADITELQKDTGFIPRYSFEEGIWNTVKFCMEEEG